MELPSNKIGALLLVVVVVVSGTISLNSYQEKNKVLQNSNPQNVDGGDNQIVTIKLNTEENSTDSDGDSLADWEETLWGTDPNNPDSDGDGTTDGEEVQNNRDPKIPGPDDSRESLLQKDLSNPEDIYAHRVAGSLTDQLAVNLASNYFNLKQGQSLTQESSEELITKITEDIESITSQKEEARYTRNNIATFGYDIELIKQYGNQMGEIVITKNDELQSFINYEDKKYIETLIAFYKEYATDLGSIYVPQNLETVHINLMNNYYELSGVIEDMNTYETDPVLSLLAIKSYNKVAEEIAKQYEAIGIYFKENDIIFDEGELGNIWRLL